MMNSSLNSQMKRTGHPHLFAEKGSELRHSRSKIQITHIHHGHQGAQKSRYVANAPPTQPDQSAHREHSKQRRGIFQMQSSVCQPQYNNRLYALMKEQIDIASYNFKEKMGQTLKNQAKQIQRLTNMIGYNHHVILKQQEIIDKMSKNEDFMTSTVRSRIPSRDDLRGTSKSPRKISLTQNRSAKKLPPQRVEPQKQQNQMQTLNKKIITLRSRIDEIEQKLWIYSNRYKDTIFKINTIQNLLGGTFLQKITKSEQIIQKYLTSREQSLNLQSNIKGDDDRQIDHKLKNMKEEMKELKQLMFNLINREFVYDSYQLQKLRESLKGVSFKVDVLSGKDSHIARDQNKNKGEASHHMNLTQSYSLHPEPSHFLDQFQRHRSIMENSPNIAKNQAGLVQSSQVWSNGSNNLEDSDEDQFYFENPKNETIERDEILKQLQKIIVKNRSQLPVKVEIDGTGYLKDCETGMYILDEYDNGFELSSEEIEMLKQKGLIYI